MRPITARSWNPLARFRPRPVASTHATPPPTRECPKASEAVVPRHPVPGDRPSVEVSPDPTASGDHSICVTVLVENSVHGRHLQAEHGLAFYLHAGRWRMLFDTGQSDLVLRNAATLGLPLDQLNAIALSHGHYDHTGGLRALREIAPTARVFLHPDAPQPKYSGQPDGTARSVGMAPELVKDLWHGEADLVWTRTPTEVQDGLFLTGEIPRITDFEDTGGRFFKDEPCVCPDPLRDDQALFFDTADGVVVLLGCGHAGVVNTLRYVRELTGGRPVAAVLGGFHLLNADERRLQRTLAALDDLNVRTLGAAHCTGPVAQARLWTTFPDRCCACAVGSEFVFRPSGAPPRRIKPTR